MLRPSDEPFSFRYVSFQKGMHKTSEFLALSRWGQVPVLVDSGRIYAQSAAIVEHLAETLGRFQGHDSATRQAVRQWLYWDVDALFPPIFNGYAVQLGERKLLPIAVEPMIAKYYRGRAEAALSVLDSHLANRSYLCAAEPTIADLFCYGDVGRRPGDHLGRYQGGAAEAEHSRERHQAGRRDHVPYRLGLAADEEQ
jgi:glutathione S-transferase